MLRLINQILWPVCLRNTFNPLILCGFTLSSVYILGGGWVGLGFVVVNIAYFYSYLFFSIIKSISDTILEQSINIHSNNL